MFVFTKKISQEVAALCQKEKTSKNFFADVDQTVQAYECEVLVTSLNEEILTIAQHYRDRNKCSRFVTNQNKITYYSSSVK